MVINDHIYNYIQERLDLLRHESGGGHNNPETIGARIKELQRLKKKFYGEKTN